MGKKNKPYRGKSLTERMAVDRHVVARFEDGEPICVARPANQELARKLTTEAVKLATEAVGGDKNATWERVQQRLNDECGPYTFVGYMSAGDAELLLDEKGRAVGAMEEGDSLVHPSFFEEAN